MAPLVPVVLAFVSGIFISGWNAFAYPVNYIAFAASFLPLVFCLMRGVRFSLLPALPPFIILGVIFMQPYSNPSFPPDHIRNLVRGVSPVDDQIGTQAEGTLLYAPEAAGERTRLLVEAQSVLRDDRWTGVEGKVLLTVQGHIEGLSAGDRVRFFARLREPASFGNPGEFDYNRWLNRQGIFVTGFVKSPSFISINKRSAADSWRLPGPEAARGAIRSFIDRSGARHKEPLKALIIGEQRGIEKPVRDAFSRTATTHIISISGLHVGIVALFAYAVFFYLMKRSERLALAFNLRKAAALFTILPVVAYGALAGFPVPAERAVIMACAFAVCFALDRGKDFFNTLALSAMTVLVITPYALWDVSFQLTYAAMLSLAYLVPRFTSIIKKALPWMDAARGRSQKSGLSGAWHRAIAFNVAPLVLATVAAGLGTAPVIAWHFHRVSLTGAAANLVVVPLTSFTVPLLIVSSVVLPVSETLARLPLHAADVAFDWAYKAAELFAALPYASVWTAAPSLPWIIGFYGLAVSTANLPRRSFAYAGALFAALLIIVSLYPLLKEKATGEMRVTFLSVGQGDSALIEFPDGKTMLVDGGGGRNPEFDVGEKVVAPFLSYRSIRRLDYIVLSHAQLDHMGGLGFIVENFDVGEFWWNGVGDLGRLGTELEKRGVKVVEASAPMELSSGKAFVRLIHPKGETGLDINDMSIVMKAGYGACSVLLTGDIGQKAEESIVKGDISAAVLKVPHHGGRYSSSTGFIEKVSPAVAVVSVGRYNPFRHPHEDTLERYRLAGATLMRTDTDGAVTVTADGGACVVSGHLTQALR